jgi:hypothetical protein
VRVTDVYTTPSVVINIAVLVVAFVVLHYSRFGRTVYAPPPATRWPVSATSSTRSPPW